MTRGDRGRGSRGRRAWPRKRPSIPVDLRQDDPAPPLPATATPPPAVIPTPSLLEEVEIPRYQDMSHRDKRYTQESAGSGSFSSSGDRICYCGLQL
ncbi:hypothetical protein PIB30_059872 [Stylosanthes scabra]|uniref:Uncharacterized protein n=1 Tax=Stylosanthes scabra TaxID=79078 RepID=A0ABU6TMH9_9FABA|nr:hypothetical protein [Stylosanthes scabra]